MIRAMAATFDCVVSLCDGIAMARDSLRAAGVAYKRYIGVEIDEKARDIADYRAGNDKQPPIERHANDITEFAAAGVVPQGASVLLIAGIPCTERSFANTKYKGINRVAQGTGSGLIRQFARILDEVRTTAGRVDFIVENVPSEATANNFYSRLLGVEPVLINAAWFGAQHRKRLFWASWDITAPPREQWSRQSFADIAEPDDDTQKHYDFVLWQGAAKDNNKPHRIGVLPTKSVLRQIKNNTAPASPKVYGDGKCAAITANGSKGGGGALVQGSIQDGASGRRAGQKERVYNNDGKMTSIVANTGAAANNKIAAKHINQNYTAAVISGKYKARAVLAKTQSDGYKVACRGDIVRRQFIVDGTALELDVVVDGARCLTVGEIERLFGLPAGNTAAPGVSRTARIRALGGGWHILQMAHCLKQINNGRRGLFLPQGE